MFYPISFPFPRTNKHSHFRCVCFGLTLPHSPRMVSLWAAVSSQPLRGNNPFAAFSFRDSQVNPVFDEEQSTCLGSNVKQSLGLMMPEDRSCPVDSCCSVCCGLERSRL